MISPHPIPRSVQRDLVYAACTREYIATGQVTNDYKPTEIEYQWCQDRIQQLEFMAEAMGGVDKLRLQLKIHLPGANQ